MTGEDLVGFALQADEASRLEVVCAHYFARVDEAQVNDIRLALSTTTFNNERFILPNIDLVKGAVAAEVPHVRRGQWPHARRCGSYG